MGEALPSLIKLASEFSGVPVAKLSAKSAIDQDLKIVGMDIWELVDSLAEQHGEFVREWPWQRFCDLDEPNGLVGLLLIWRLLTWPFRGRLFDPSPYERLELGHIAAVIETGEWFDP